MNVVFGPLARREHEEAFDYYEAQELGLGEKFRCAVWGAIGIVERYPHSSAEIRPGVCNPVAAFFLQIAVCG